ncbi:hypothetical protein Tsubulata_005110 [Turnera subulata]|uniref:DUF4283 domain-containing protein n=1 Tax=Turnera subulata TaxID=218843 RepID=A0A9Q0J9Q0_9ROSI|nr:hypothetical protein Tsubulata_005110 [Turnera subulata]
MPPTAKPGEAVAPLAPPGATVPSLSTTKTVPVVMYITLTSAEMQLPPSSFKEKLLAGGQSMASATEADFEEQEGDIVSFLTPEGPIIKISDRYRNMLHKCWENTLIVKMWGRNIGYRTLCSRLPNLWKLKENFNPSSHKITSIVAWIQIPGLSSEYYDRGILRVVCNEIGKLVQLDHNTERQICTSRRGIGPISTPSISSHLMSACPSRKLEKERSGGDQEAVRTSDDQATGTTNEQITPVRQASQPSVQPLRGEWMIAGRRRRPARLSGGQPNKESTPGKEKQVKGKAVVNAQHRKDHATPPPNLKDAMPLSKSFLLKTPINASICAYSLSIPATLGKIGHVPRKIPKTRPYSYRSTSTKTNPQDPTMTIPATPPTELANPLPPPLPPLTASSNSAQLLEISFDITNLGHSEPIDALMSDNNDLMGLELSDNTVTESVSLLAIHKNKETLVSKPAQLEAQSFPV